MGRILGLLIEDRPRQALPIPPRTIRSGARTWSISGAEPLLIPAGGIAIRRVAAVAGGPASRCCRPGRQDALGRFPEGHVPLYVSAALPLAIGAMIARASDTAKAVVLEKKDGFEDSIRVKVQIGMPS